MSKLGYKGALEWLVINDDCHWLDEEKSSRSMSVSAAFAADIYGVTDEKLEKDLRKMQAKIFPE